MSIHLPMHQPEIMKMTFVLLATYLETTYFSVFSDPSLDSL